MRHFLTSAVEIDPQQVSSFFDKLRSMSFSGLIKIAVLAVVLLVVIRLLDGFAKRFIENSKIDKSLHGFLRAMVKIILYFLGVLILAGSLDIDVTSLIAMFSVAGLALSLALQGALSNIASGIVILTTKPLRVGDYVVIGSNEGFVESIGMTYTELRTYDSRLVYIPNSTVTTSNVVNYTVSGKRRVDLTVTASYDCALEDVKAALLEAVAAVPGLLREDEVFARVTGYNDSNIAYTIRAWCKNEDYWSAYYDLMESVKTVFDRKGIQMTYPHLNVHLQND